MDNEDDIPALLLRRDCDLQLQPERFATVNRTIKNKINIKINEKGSSSFHSQIMTGVPCTEK